ncbi:MAG TPA: response regulator [Opitutaceae bacterium]|nr:response regulator [Opitutaceae bacterium]
MATVLIVDDSDSIRALLQAALVAAGHTVLTAADGQHGIRMFSGNEIDVLVTDVYMPNADGLDVLREWRRLERGPNVIVMSSKTGPMNMLRSAKHLGAKMTLQKPFPAEKLVAAINSMLTGAKKPVSGNPADTQ